jgi:hypothetical protein
VPVQPVAGFGHAQLDRGWVCAIQHIQRGSKKLLQNAVHRAKRRVGKDCQGLGLGVGLLADQNVLGQPPFWMRAPEIGGIRAVW